MRFEIIYEVKGTRKVLAFVPDTHELPDNWSALSAKDKDEWIYSRQSASEFMFEDIHHAEATSIEWQD